MPTGPTPPAVEYRDDVSTLTAERLRGGFFEGWPDPPTPEGHLRHLRGCEAVLMAVDLDRLGDRYAVDLVADDDVAPFYERLGGTRGRALMWRNRT